MCCPLTFIEGPYLKQPWEIVIVLAEKCGGRRCLVPPVGAPLQSKYYVSLEDVVGFAPFDNKN